MVLDDIAHELYGRLPEDFTQARNAYAKEVAAGGDGPLASQVRKLPKPTMAAWLANGLVRSHAKKVEQLTALGPQLREALRTGARPEMRRVADRRRDLIKELVDAASHAASEVGRPMASPVQRQLEETLEAAVADPQSAALLRTGNLHEPLAFVGFGRDTSSTPGPVAGPDRRKPTRRPSGHAGPDEKRHVVQDALDEAARALPSAQKAADRAKELVEEARGRSSEASTRERNAARELHAAGREVAKTEQQLKAARQARTEVEQRLRDAARDHRRLEAELRSMK